MSDTFNSLPPKLSQCFSDLGGGSLPRSGAERGGGERRSLKRPPEGAALSLGVPRRLGVWPGLGIFVLFKCQRLLLTPLPNMFLIYPAYLLREKLKEKMHADLEF